MKRRLRNSQTNLEANYSLKHWNADMINLQSPISVLTLKLHAEKGNGNKTDYRIYCAIWEH